MTHNATNVHNATRKDDPLRTRQQTIAELAAQDGAPPRPTERTPAARARWLGELHRFALAQAAITGDAAHYLTETGASTYAVFVETTWTRFYLDAAAAIRAQR